MTTFTHLHLHTQYSILDGAAKIPLLMKKAEQDGMTAMAITDHGNMYGAMKFVIEAKKHKIKPLIGCEMYVAANGMDSKKNKDDRSGYHLVLLAKNKTGYLNLIKLVSLAFKDGFYYTPRIDKNLLRQYSEGLIASSACLGGQIPKAILTKGKDEAKIIIEEFKDIFGEDFYLELMRHGIPEQKIVNEKLIELAHETKVDLIATNDVHYVNKEDFEAHHILICLNTGKDADSKDGMKYTGNEFFRTTQEMAELFADIPEAIENTQKLVNKIEKFELEMPVQLPHFPLPGNFENENDYLRHLCFEGAKKRYDPVDDEVTSRLEHELGIISNMGFAGYFLIVQDYINVARQNGTLVGPGRGSAAGSAVAFCIGITNIDPIKYELLFERFLNPERISMPDIDVDFDDYGRDDIIQYVADKYGRDKVAQIVTFGSMASRSSIRDVARVLKLPLAKADYLAKLVPEGTEVTLKKAFKSVKEFSHELENGSDLVKKTLELAQKLEGSARNTGTHACGVIIAPDEITKFVPLATAKDSNLMVTQYDGKYIEKAGMLKMDFLGLKTLTIIKDTLENIKKNKDVDIDIEDIPLDDAGTFELFQKGQTIGIFQFESPGMQKNLIQLEPTTINDLIAMNALYRPGPMSFIETYIKRKHGKEKTEYLHPLLEPILKSTYGILVFQEQIMQTARIIGGFSLARADILRRAMGKKKHEEMQKMEVEFVEGAVKQNIEEAKAKYIFTIMQEFANYGFNRSHSAAYSVIAYQTAYLKSNFPAEFMSAVLAHNMSDINKVHSLVSECNRMEMEVLGPDINESQFKFTALKNRKIRFGLGAVKGVGKAAVEAIIEERDKNGFFKSIFDLTSRVNLRAVNKRCLESLAYAGGFDSFDSIHRRQYFFTDIQNEQNLLDKATKYGNRIKESLQSAQQSLFADTDLVHLVEPAPPECEPWSSIELLKFEKEYLGYYVSGHPLDDFIFDLEQFTTTDLVNLTADLTAFKGKTIRLGGMVSESTERLNKKGEPYGMLTLEDYTSDYKFFVFKEKYLKYKHLFEPGTKVFIVAQVKPRYNDDTLMNIDIQEISLLSDVRSKMLLRLNLFADLDAINKELIDRLYEIFIKHPGNCPVYLKISGNNNDNHKVSVELLPKELRIDPNNLCLADLGKLQNTSLSIN